MEQTTFTKRKLGDLLAQLQASPEDYLTVYLTPSSLPDCATFLAGKPFAEEIVQSLDNEAVKREVERYGTGLVLVWSSSEIKIILLPPFPVLENKVSWGRPEVLPLQNLLQKERTLGVVLVTWGWYAFGVFQGDGLIDYKTGTGHIHETPPKRWQ